MDEKKKNTGFLEKSDNGNADLMNQNERKNTIMLYIK